MRAPGLDVSIRERIDGKDQVGQQALEVGALRPQMSVLEEQAKGTQMVNGEDVPFEDLRGIDGFVGTELARYRVGARGELRRMAVESKVAQRPKDQAAGHRAFGPDSPYAAGDG